jgi:hypothetical protein
MLAIVYVVCYRLHWIDVYDINGNFYFSWFDPKPYSIWKDYNHATQ